MATEGSIPVEEEVVQLSEEEQASVDEIIKETENSSAFEDTVVVAETDDQNNEPLPDCKDIVLKGILQNQTMGPLHLCETMMWAGMVKQFPHVIPAFNAAVFIIEGPLPGGVEAAVVYAGKNARGDDCGWLLAFMDSAGGMRVYVDCGRIIKFRNINWRVVKEKLKHSKATARHYDPETGTSAVAKIDRIGCDGSTCKDRLVAAFAG